MLTSNCWFFHRFPPHNIGRQIQVVSPGPLIKAKTTSSLLSSGTRPTPYKDDDGNNLTAVSLTAVLNLGFKFDTESRKPKCSQGSDDDESLSERASERGRNSSCGLPSGRGPRTPPRLVRVPADLQDVGLANSPRALFH
jgi:hypothetical protein